MIEYHYDIIQQSEEWYKLRCGVLTASDMHKIITAKKLEFAENQTCRDHLNDLLAQKITGFSDSSYRSDDMLRGLDDEKEAKNIYEQHYGKVTDCGFVTNDKFGFMLGCSPDGLLGDSGGMQIKCRKGKFQIDTIIAGAMPDEYRIQVQTEMLVTERPWWDFVSYSGGLHMMALRIEADLEMHEAIVDAAREFYSRLDVLSGAYQKRVFELGVRLVPTTRVIRDEITV